MNRNTKLLLALCLLLGAALAASPAAAGKGKGQRAPAKWMSGDFHQHTLYTDGGNTFDFVMQKNVEYGLDWWANSEHGGERNRDGNGQYWDERADVTILGWYEERGGHQEMWRWQSLTEYVYPDILRNRALYPSKKIVSGLEWNVPGHEHCSTAIIAEDASALSAFEYQFDGSDEDYSREGEMTPYGMLVKTNGRTNYVQDVTDVDSDAKPGDQQHADAVAACAWMQKQLDDDLIEDGWIIFAHPERDGEWELNDPEGYNVEHFRDFNNAAPDICFGFEGAPGHQTSNGRGGFGSGAFGGTYGGAGYYTAKVGGLWDALLGEGRHWFNFASSDYHWHTSVGGGDFYPGEYQKTWTNVQDLDRDGDYSMAEIAEGLRSGNSFHVMGDLIDSLEFTAWHADNKVVMGQDLHMQPRKKAPLKIKIRFSSPAVNNNGDVPVVDHVDLIAGTIRGKIDPSDPDYTNPTNPGTRILATFTSADWETDDEGNNVIVATIKDMDEDTYFRLRFTNQAPGTYAETDEAGNPLADSLATELLGLNRAEEAWADLWAYSNPIFVYTK